MVYLPNELINIIFSYVERPKHEKIMKYLIEDCYQNDYNPYTSENWSDNYCFEYSFVEWYSLYRLQCKLGGIQMRYMKKNLNLWKFIKYKHTPVILKVGVDKMIFINCST